MVHENWDYLLAPFFFIGFLGERDYWTVRFARKYSRVIN